MFVSKYESSIIFSRIKFEILMSIIYLTNEKHLLWARID